MCGSYICWLEYSWSCIPSYELIWFNSYFSNRYQFTRVNNVDCKFQNIGIGAPQGSCYFFSTSIMPQSACMQIILALVSNHSIPQLIKPLNQDLEALYIWLRGNKLSLNVAKTHSMIISTKQKLKLNKICAYAIKIWTVFNALSILESILIMHLIGKSIFKKFQKDFSVS